MKKLKNKLLLAVISAYIMVFVIMFVRINIRYKNPTLEQVNIGQVIEVNGYELRVNSAGFIDNDILHTEYEEYLGKYEDCKMYSISMSIKKVKEDVEDFSLSYIEFVSGAYRNATSLELFKYINRDTFKPFKYLEYNDEVTYIFPFRMVKENFTDTQWKNIENNVFELDTFLYPVKKIINLTGN